jgi:hypothetical protein
MRKAGILLLLAVMGFSTSCSDGRVDLGNEEEVRGPNQPPSTPTGLQAAATAHDTIQVSFQPATDDGGAVEYRIYRYGEAVGETSGETYTDTGLVFASSFCYTVTSVDGDGLESAPSGEFCATTPQAPSGTIATWAGDGTQGFDGDGNALAKSRFDQPMEMNFDPAGVAYVVDWNSHRIRRVVDGRLETVIGVELPGDWPCQEPADPANCEVPLSAPLDGALLPLNHPMDIVFSPEHHSTMAFVGGWHNHKVLQYDTAGGQARIISGQQSVGFVGDNGPAAAAKLNFPSSVVVDSAGNLFVSDERNNRIRRIANDANRTITTVAGISNVSVYAGDGGVPTAANLALQPYILTSDPNPPPGGGLAMDGSGNLYVADTFNHCIRVISPGADGIVGSGDGESISTVAGVCGENSDGYGGDGGALSAAIFNTPFDLDFGPEGHLYVVDTGNHAIRAVDLSANTLKTVAGTGSPGFSGDNGLATAAKLKSPYGIAFSPSGNLYIVDTFNNRIRIVAK